MYNKLFTKILDSSIWLESNPTRIVWFTFLAAMDEDGFAQFASIANLAHRARVTLVEAEIAVKTLTEPDPNSSNPDHDGRRLERVPGGWMVLNAGKYREIVTRVVALAKTRDRVARFRAAKAGNAHVTPGNGAEHQVTPRPKMKRSVTPSGSEAGSESGSEPNPATAAPPRQRNPLLDALVLHAESTELAAAIPQLWAKCAAALKTIRTVSPDVTAAEIAQRCANYRTHFDNAALTATALANHWGRCAVAKSGRNGPSDPANSRTIPTFAKP